MKRRSFLGLLGGAVVAPAVKAEPVSELTFTTPEVNFASDRCFVVSGIETLTSRTITFNDWKTSPEEVRALVLPSLNVGDHLTIAGKDFVVVEKSG